MKEIKQLKLTNLILPSWFTRPHDSSIWVTGYRTFRIPKESLSKSKAIGFAQVCAIILYGKLDYFKAGQIQNIIEIDNQLHVNVSPGRQRQEPEDSYLLFTTPFKKDGGQEDETLARQNISIAAGLFAAFNGRNIVYERLFDNVINLSDGQTSSFSNVFVNPLTFAPPDVSGPRINTIVRAEQTIANWPEPERNRAYLSLRWFESAIRESGTDAYLKYWFALETLGMPNTTNIRPLNDSLSRAYNLSQDTVKNHFAVGRLQGLRSRIVHEGQIIPIHKDLLDYLEALYADILNEHLGLPCEERANRVKSNSESELSTYLK